MSKNFRTNQQILSSFILNLPTTNLYYVKISLEKKRFYKILLDKFTTI